MTTDEARLIVKLRNDLDDIKGRMAERDEEFEGQVELLASLGIQIKKLGFYKKRYKTWRLIAYLTLIYIIIDIIMMF